GSELGSEIIRCRCAEVLTPSPLPLDDSLQAVMCRSAAERATLLHYLGNEEGRWADRIQVYAEAGLFESNFAYVDTFDANSEGVAFTFHSRRDGAPIETQVLLKTI